MPETILEVSSKPKTSGESKHSIQEFSELIHHLSHDVRNVLHNIYGYSQLLGDDNDEEYIDKMQKLVMKCEEIIKAYVENVDSGNLSTD